ncbi:MAG: tRNA (N(6)-L-threonylcarbamoyladenosine(37)-C(2))-methylthiotransferase MtaB [Clostridia bacterium]|nr:tRNA (N(6)-L-threonylcarbamoyladenosine(37)-C(2))-methylthiotransferase MtaB [Clostridia bacterium]
MSNIKKTASILTLGCRVNQYESDYIVQSLVERGFEIVPFGTTADVTVVNTCTVTAESDRKSRQMIRRAVGASPDGAVIVTGCYTETGEDSVRSIDGVTYLTGNARKSAIPEAIDMILAGDVPESCVEDINSAEFDNMILKTPERTRSYIKIEDGCDNKCTYCIISSARGKVRSKPMDDIITEAKSLREAGCREVILTGIETAAYGRDFTREPYYGHSLAGVIEQVAALGFERIGLGSLEPTVMRSEFASRVSKVPALMPHFHLSVQSGSTGVLNRMRRRYNADMLKDSVRNLKAHMPEATLSADIIVGFPGETEEEFAETLELVREVKFLHLHIFPYSIREGTEAAKMKDQIPGPVKTERLRVLSAAAAEIKRDLLTKYVVDHTDAPVYVLVEKVERGVATGHSEHYVEVSFPWEADSVGEIIPVFLSETDGDTCRGKVCS